MFNLEKVACWWVESMKWLIGFSLLLAGESVTRLQASTAEVNNGDCDDGDADVSNDHNDDVYVADE